MWGGTKIILGSIAPECPRGYGPIGPGSAKQKNRRKGTEPSDRKANTTAIVTKQLRKPKAVTLKRVALNM